jgi:hypothetical protein
MLSRMQLSGAVVDVVMDAAWGSGLVGAIHVGGKLGGEMAMERLWTAMHALRNGSCAFIRE